MIINIIINNNTINYNYLMNNNKVCSICKSSYYDPLKSNLINKYNVYLDIIKPLNYKNNNSLSLLASGDPDKIREYKEDQILRENHGLLKNYIDDDIGNISAKTKLISACKCNNRVYHKDCLIQHCLLHVQLECDYCDSLYNIHFKSKSKFNCLNIFYIILIVLTIITTFIIGVMYLTHNLSSVYKISEEKIESIKYSNNLLYRFSKLKHLNIIIGIIFVIISLILALILLFYIKFLMIKTVSMNYAIKDRTNNSNTNKSKKTVIYNPNRPKKTILQNLKSVISNNITVLDNNVLVNNKFNKNDIIKQYSLFIEFASLKLNLDKSQLYDLKIRNYQQSNLEIINRSKLLTVIQQANIEYYEDEKQKRDNSQELDIVLEDCEMPKKRPFSSIKLQNNNKKGFRFNLTNNIIINNNNNNNMSLTRNNISHKLALFDCFEDSSKLSDKKNISSSVYKPSNKETILKRSNSFTKQSIDKKIYNTLCVKKIVEKKPEKQSHIHDIFNINLVKLKPNEKTKEEKVSLLGGVIKKKREKENKNMNNEVLNTSKIRQKSTMFKKNRLPSFSLMGNYLHIIRKKKEESKKKKQIANEYSNLKTNDNCELSNLNECSNLQYDNRLISSHNYKTNDVNFDNEMSLSSPSPITKKKLVDFGMGIINQNNSNNILNISNIDLKNNNNNNNVFNDN